MTTISLKTPEMIEEKEDWINKGKPRETIRDISFHLDEKLIIKREKSINERYCSQWDEDSRMYIQSIEYFIDKSLTDEYIPKMNWLYKKKIKGLWDVADIILNR